jgi:hypothetical protein
LGIELWKPDADTSAVRNKQAADRTLGMRIEAAFLRQDNL